MSTEILPHNIPALSQEDRDSNSIRIPYSPLRFWRGYPSCEMMNNGLKRWKILLLLYTKEINKLWNCFLSSSGYSKMGKKCKYGWFFKGHQWCWYRFPNCNFPPDFGPLCNGFFFRLYHVRCAFFSTRHHTILVLYQRQKNMKTMYVQCRIHKWSVNLTMLLLFVLICRLINFLIS